jgi:vanillate O-demethylase ferredoxin subunit
MQQLAVKIKRIRDEAIDVKSFQLASADGAPLPAFTPGSRIDVFLFSYISTAVSRSAA